MNYPLAGMKILDFTTLLPGPYGTMLLADHGADIIKIENFNNPDLLRTLPPFIDSVSAGFAQLNRGKRFVALDLKKEKAREVIYRLVGEYDIVIEQFRPGVMERLGIGYHKLKEINDRLIFCSLTGYGQSGSFSGRAGHDINYLSLAGISSYSGKKETGPVLNGIQIADIAGGSHGVVISVLIAYIKRLNTGEGERIDISMTDSVFSLSAQNTAGFLSGGEVPSLGSTFLNGGHIYDYYRTSDGRYLSVGPIEEKFFLNFCKSLGLQESEYPRMITADEIMKMKKWVAQKIGEKPLDAWIKIFRNTDACVEPVLNLDEALSAPPLSEREMVVRVSDSSGNKIRQVGNPIKYGSGSYYAKTAGKAIGYDNRAVLSNAGYSDREIEKMFEEGLINIS